MPGNACAKIGLFSDKTIGREFFLEKKLGKSRNKYNATQVSDLEYFDEK
jgi:hypothetical protein